MDAVHSRISSLVSWVATVRLWPRHPERPEALVVHVPDRTTSHNIGTDDDMGRQVSFWIVDPRVPSKGQNERHTVVRLPTLVVCFCRSTSMAVLCFTDDHRRDTGAVGKIVEAPADIRSFLVFLENVDLLSEMSLPLADAFFGKSLTCFS